MDQIKEILSAKCYKYYLKEIQVGTEHIDHYQHVNNLVYMQWFLAGAEEHSTSLGYGAEKYKKIGAAFFVRKHEITYHQPAYHGDRLVLATWCGRIRAGSATRFYELYRLENQNGTSFSPPVKLTSGSTLWAFVNLETKEPQMIPEELKNVFSDQSISS